MPREPASIDTLSRITEEEVRGLMLNSVNRFRTSEVSVLLPVPGLNKSK